MRTTITIMCIVISFLSVAQAARNNVDDTHKYIFSALCVIFMCIAARIGVLY